MTNDFAAVVSGNLTEAYFLIARARWLDNRNVQYSLYNVTTIPLNECVYGRRQMPVFIS